MASNTGSGAAGTIKRIMRELNDIQAHPDPEWTAAPVNVNDPYEWHFTLRGSADSAFEGGIYHGRILLPQNYPLSPPTLVFLTVNGRFQVGEKVCLSATEKHPESWQPAWGIRSLIQAVQAFFPTPGEGALNSLDWPDNVRRELAAQSPSYRCAICQLTNAEIMATSTEAGSIPDFPQRVTSLPSGDSEQPSVVVGGEETISNMHEPQITPSDNTNQMKPPAAPPQPPVVEEQPQAPLTYEERVARRTPRTAGRSNQLSAICGPYVDNAGHFAAFLYILLRFGIEGTFSSLWTLMRERFFDTPASSPVTLGPVASAPQSPLQRRRALVLFWLRWSVLISGILLLLVLVHIARTLKPYWRILEISNAQVLNTHMHELPINYDDPAVWLELQELEWASNMPHLVKRIAQWIWQLP